MTDPLQAALERSRNGEAVVLATVVWRRGPSSGKLGAHAVIDADGRVDGWIGGACAQPVVVRQAREVLAVGEARLVHLAPPDELGEVAVPGAVTVPMSCENEGALQVFLQPLTPAPHLVVVGRSPAVDTLVALAGVLGWRTVVVDDGGAAEDHPAADVVIGSLDLQAAGVTDTSMVVVATQGHYDEDAVEQAVRTPAPYIGLVAAPRRAQRIRELLADRGVADDSLARVRAPAGLDLGPTGHAEIAVAVLAELVALRATGELAAVPDTAPGPPPSEAVDPVCGMTVAVAGSRHTATHEGVRYHFCCAGCHASFVADPDHHLVAGHDR